MLSKLTKLKIGLREVQEYSDALQLRIRSDNFKNKSEQNVEKLILDRMNFILRDEKCYCGELGVTRDRLRREMKVFLGENTRRTRTIIAHLRSLASKEKIFHTARYSKKLNYLRERFVMRGSEKLDEVPDDLRNFEEAKVFCGRKFDKIVEDKIEVQIVGTVRLSENEESVLRLHPKFALMSDLKEMDMDLEMELCFAKIRYQLLKEIGEKLTDEEEEELRKTTTIEEMEKMEEDDARSRQVFDPEKKNFDYRKKRVTDLKENSRVCLPKPLPAIEEASIELRRENIRRVFREIKAKVCNKRGQQKSNLTEGQEEGIKSLRKRIADEEIIVMKTDKSGKFAITDRDNYEEMGRAHTGKDRVIGDDEARDRERVINGHTSMWLKMTNLGEKHNHEDRARESKIGKSTNLASMYLLLKDHKEKLSTRPVVTGCDSNTLGLSNMVAELLEAVCNSMTSPYEVISTEDMLSRLEDCNREMKNMRAEKLARGEELTEEDNQLYIIANDVVALFPSMTSEMTGKVVRELMEETELEIDSLDGTSQ